MACSHCSLEGRKDTFEAGFATPAAVVISLALATVAVAVQVRAVAALHASQADYLQAAAETRLDGAQAMAVAALAGGQNDQAGRWRMTLDDIAITARAEPEAAKLPLSAAAALAPDVLAALGASRPTIVQAGLARIATSGDGDPEALSRLDPDPRWKACGARVLSAYGQGLSLPGEALAPNLQAHGGEVWRVQVSDGWGWTDTRIVRFTGDVTSPARVIYRSFYRSRSGDPPCPLVRPAAA